MVEVLNDPKVTVAKTVLVNSLYELESWCTSIIARQADGTIIHSRNLDFDNADSMRKITYNAKFVHGTKPAFEAVMFGGVAGVYTGVKPGAFSISENQREFNKGSIGLFEQIPDAKKASDLNVASYYKRLDREFSSSEYVAGSRYTVADITLLSAIDFASSMVDLKPSESLKNLNRWHEQINSRPSSKL